MFVILSKLMFSSKSKLVDFCLHLTVTLKKVGRFQNVADKANCLTEDTLYVNTHTHKSKKTHKQTIYNTIMK